MDLRVGCGVSSSGVEDKRLRLWQESAKGGQRSRYSKVWAEKASSETFLQTLREWLFLLPEHSVGLFSPNALPNHPMHALSLISVCVTVTLPKGDQQSPRKPGSSR